MTASRSVREPREVRASAGEPIRDLALLLREMRPRLHEGTFAFCLVPEGVSLPPGAIGWFREAEGQTAILPVEDARAFGLPVRFESAWITLEVHSALVGRSGEALAALHALAGPG